MKFSIKNLDKCRRKLRDNDSIRCSYRRKEKLLEFMLNMQIFQHLEKGKAPLNVVENKYNKEIINDIKEQLLPMFYQKAIQESEIKVVNIIEYSEINIGSNLFLQNLMLPLMFIQNLNYQNILIFLCLLNLI